MADPRPTEPEQDEEEEDLLDALERSLGEPVDHPPGAPRGSGAPPAAAPSSGPSGPSGTGSPPSRSLGSGLVHWPREVRICIAKFLPWGELVGNSLLCHAWRSLEREDVLWRAHFQRTWPRIPRRRMAHSERGLPWRSLFRAHWARTDRTEDNLEEDWLDFKAAQDLQGSGGGRSTRSDALAQLAASPELETALLQTALQRCREALLAHGVQVPAEADRTHLCSRSCRYHRLPVDGDAFVCESSGALHICRQGEPCDACVRSDEGCFLVCPASGRCFPLNDAPEEEVGEALAQNDWDPELSMTAQFGRWFEQGYFMSEEQARFFFGPDGDERGRRVRRRT